MLAFLMTFLTLLANPVARFCAGCAGCCAGFVQGLTICNSLIAKGKTRFVQTVQAKRTLLLACARWRGCAPARVYARMISPNLCTPCIILCKLLKNRKKVIIKTLHKPCTNPAQLVHSF